LTLLFDLETDGLLGEVSRIHCIVTIDTDTEEVRAYHDDISIEPRHGSISDGCRAIEEAGDVAGHNILEYDYPVLKKLRGMDRTCDEMFDTIIMSRLCYSDRKEKDFALHKADRLHGKYIGQHSLGAWGQRLGEHKGEYTGGWEKFSQDMLDYCIQDCVVNLKLYRHLVAVSPPDQCVRIEHRFAKQLFEQQERGVQLDFEAMDSLLEELIERKAVLIEEIREIFPALEVKYKKRKDTGKRTMRMCPVRNKKCDSKLVPFNPGSRQQLAARLIKKHGWVPEELTKRGAPSMVETVMLDLVSLYPEVKPVMEYLVVNNRISILSDSPGSYSRLADSQGRLHGRTIHIGAATHRCAHSKPNTGNVTSVRKPYGAEIRKLFVPFTGFCQAGYDADGLELRMLAHFLYPYDGGAYVESVTRGTKEAGTDPHSVHARVISTVAEVSRDRGKNTTYALLYGAGDIKLGKMHGGSRQLGRRVREALITQIPGLQQLYDALGVAVERGWIMGLDGRRIGIRHIHAALNTLLQSAGAVVMKYVPVFLEDLLNQTECRYGHEYLQTGHVHDEGQGSVKPQYKEVFSRCVTEAFAQTERILNLNVPLAGEAEFGDSWADTH